MAQDPTDPYNLTQEGSSTAGFLFYWEVLMPLIGGKT